jgi:hypothetical protein
MFEEQKTQYKQCTYKVLVTLRRVRATIVAVDNNEYYTSWVCVFVALRLVVKGIFYEPLVQAVSEADP